MEQADGGGHKHADINNEQSSRAAFTQCTVAVTAATDHETVTEGEYK